MYLCTVGIDWGSTSHALCVLDHTGKTTHQRIVKREGAALIQCTQWLLSLAATPSQIAVAIETPHEALIEALIEHGVHVFTINPKQTERWRGRRSVSGAKDDRLDAEVLACALQSEPTAFHQLTLQRPELLFLRELCRIDEALTRDRVALLNRLRQHVGRSFIQALALCPNMTSPWIWSFLELAPTPATARGLGEARIGEILKSHRIRTLTVADIIAALEQPDLPVAPGVTEASAEHIRSLLPRIQIVHSQQSAITKRIRLHLLTGIPSMADDIERLYSVPGIGDRVLATLISECGDVIEARAYHRLRILAGTAPVTQRSGKRTAVVMRRSVKLRLRSAVYHIARTAMIRDEYIGTLYRQMRTRGLSHPRALRGAADRYLLRICAMLQAGEMYNSSLSASASKKIL